MKFNFDKNLSKAKLEQIKNSKSTFKVYAYRTYVRGSKFAQFCKDIKWYQPQERKNKQGILNMAANMLVSVLPEGCLPILIPIPNHFGKATYTLDLAKLVAKKTEGKCLDILSGPNRLSRHETKLQGIENNIEFSLKNDINDFKNCQVFLVDNVMGEGQTYEAAYNVLKDKFKYINLLVLGTTNKRDDFRQVKTSFYSPEMFDTDY